jgi:Ni/Co efflux regulator RcnB
MRRLVVALVAVLAMAGAMTGARAQVSPELIEKLKALAASPAGQAGIAQAKSKAQATYAQEEQEWAACKALPDVNSRATCYEGVHDRVSAQVSGFLK